MREAIKLRSVAGTVVDFFTEWLFLVKNYFMQVNKIQILIPLASHLEIDPETSSG